MLLWCERTSIELRLIILEMIYTYSCLRKLELCRNNGVYISLLCDIRFRVFLPLLVIFTQHGLMVAIRSILFLFFIIFIVNVLSVFIIVFILRFANAANDSITIIFLHHPSEVCYGRYDMGYMTPRTTSINRPTRDYAT